MLKTSRKRKKIKLCPRGYCTAKSKYSVYPSAYANGYASQVCSGKTPTMKDTPLMNTKVSRIHTMIYQDGIRNIGSMYVKKITFHVEELMLPWI